jgi:RimJ/RimL family protein N-acetyltransferase
MAEHPRGSLPAISLRRVDAAGARAILAGVPRPEDRWASGYPAEGDREAASLALRSIGQLDGSPFCCYEIVVPGGLVVGGAGFHAPPDADGVVEIGYGVADSVRNRRYAQAAIHALVVIAAAGGATRVTARTDPENRPSRRALERCGFETVAIDHEYAHHALDCPRPVPGACEFGMSEP